MVERHALPPVQLLQPLLLTVLQLCSELQPQLGVMLRSLDLADELLRACMQSASHIRRVAALQQAQAEIHLQASPERDIMFPVPAPSDVAAAAKEMKRMYREVLHAIAQPLLHAVAPAALKAVRQVEQGLSRGAVGSSRVGVQDGTTAEQTAKKPADQLMSKFGSLVLQVVAQGESMYNCCCMFR
jgi:hypothetical protein